MGAWVWESPEKEAPPHFRPPSEAGGGTWGALWGLLEGIPCWGCGSWSDSVAMGGPPYAPHCQVLSALLAARRPYSSIFRVRRSGGGGGWGDGCPQCHCPLLGPLRGCPRTGVLLRSLFGIPHYPLGFLLGFPVTGSFWGPPLPIPFWIPNGFPVARLLMELPHYRVPLGSLIIMSL